jgi:hypothetical protein
MSNYDAPWWRDRILEVDLLTYCAPALSCIHLRALVPTLAQTNCRDLGQVLARSARDGHEEGNSKVCDPALWSGTIARQLWRADQL